MDTSTFGPGIEILGPITAEYSEILTPEALRLRHLPVADCARYDQLRRAG